MLTEAGVRHRSLPAGASVAGDDAWMLAAAELPMRIAWTDGARRWATNRRSLARRHEDLGRAVEAVVGAGPAVARAELAGLGAESILDDHQATNVVAATCDECYGLCIFDEQGTGKTITGLFAAHRLFQRDRVDLVVIVAPKSMVAEWPHDLERVLPGMYTSAILQGAPPQRRAILAAAPDFLVCNFEAVISWQAELEMLARRHDGRCLLIVDESFMVKNPEAGRSRALRSLREWFDRCLVLCGTPAPNSAHDLVGQFDLADLGATFAGVTLPDDREAAKQMATLALEQRATYLRSRKDAVLPNLPSRAIREVSVELAPVQARGYAAAQRSLILDLESIDDNTFARRLATFAARRAALLQLCSHPGAVLDGYRETPAKLAAIEGLARDLCQRGEKVVIWSFFRYSLEALFEALADLGAVRYDGTVTAADARREAVRRFQMDPDCRVFIANPAAAGAGLTLHAARHAIYESMSNQAAHWLQSLDRIHRRGQERPVEYVVLVASDTIEEDEWRRLRDKEQSARDLLSDPGEGPPTRQTMLAELQRSAARMAAPAAARAAG